MAKVKKLIAILPGIWEFDQERTFEEKLPSGAEIRMTVGWLSGYQTAQYEVAKYEAMRHAQDKYGVTASELLQDNASMSPIFIEVQSWFERAYMLAALRKVEVKQGDEWLETELPDAWHDIDRFKFAVPSSIFNQWRDATLDLNPQIFTAKPDESEKKDEPPAEITSENTSEPS